MEALLNKGWDTDTLIIIMTSDMAELTMNCIISRGTATGAVKPYSISNLHSFSQPSRTYSAIASTLIVGGTKELY